MLNHQAEIQSITALEQQLRSVTPEQGFTPYLHAAAGALQTARENLGYHQQALQKRADTLAAEAKKATEAAAAAAAHTDSLSPQRGEGQGEG